MSTSSPARVPGTYTGPSTLSQWADHGTHVAQLYSGAWVKFRFPDLSQLAGAGRVPEALKAIALQRIAGELKLLLEPGVDLAVDEPASIDEPKLRENAQLNHWLVSVMLVEPAVTPEQVAGLPHEDVELLLALATRDRDTDARGVVMGVTPLSRFARFRKAHRCGEDCADCEALRNESVASLAGGPV